MNVLSGGCIQISGFHPNILHAYLWTVVFRGRADISRKNYNFECTVQLKNAYITCNEIEHNRIFVIINFTKN
jgi:hypothetical protein